MFNKILLTLLFVEFFSLYRGFKSSLKKCFFIYACSSISILTIWELSVMSKIDPDILWGIEFLSKAFIILNVIVFVSILVYTKLKRDKV